MVLRNAHASMLPADGLFQKPLVTIDYSRFSRPAVQLAADLSAPDQTIGLIHVLYAPAAADIEPSAVESALADVRAIEIARLEEFAARVDQVPLTLHVRAEAVQLAQQILDFAAGAGTDLIVLGAHGRSEEVALLGRVADRIIRTAPAPVVVIPDRAGTHPGESEAHRPPPPTR
jgi:nucleotide-binding universal stress UspA family protein